MVFVTILLTFIKKALFFRKIWYNISIYNLGGTKLEYFNETVENLVKKFDTDIEKGLTTQKASDLRGKYGENKLKEKKKKSTLQRFFDQFKDVMIIILLIAAGVSFAIAVIEKNPKEFFEPVLILLIVILNAVMGVVQEGKAEKALDALKNMSAPNARVIRDGHETLIEAKYLVPGDIIHLEAGDFIPADARLVHSSGLKCEESALTGESVPSEKDYLATVNEDAPLGDRSNMVFSGCSVAYGTATAVVTSIGMQTQMGKIANLLDEEDEGKTPLQEKLAQLGKYLGVLALLACAVIFFVGKFNGIPFMEIFMTSVSLAVSAIPEGMPAIVTIVLSIGVQQMVKHNALIRKLPAVETLGSASIICSDKTGTLTQNRMTVVSAYTEATGESEDINNQNSDEVKKLLTYATLCCDGSVNIDGDNVELLGDPTETSIVMAAYNNSILKDGINKEYPRVMEIPFDSDRKLMTTVNKMGDKYAVIVKGAFDMMAPLCISGDIEKAKQVTEEMSMRALRVLAVGFKMLDELPKQATSQVLECDLEFMGLVGMIDPPRLEVKDAVKLCKKAGIKPVMITGDHVITASAIAKELGILNEGDRAITGAELDMMTDEELDSCVADISVYARVSPENKIRIVKAWQKKDKVVAMTGDGVNDAPALKAADIGCAMGITGTDVAKGAADMTLTDDNFATIVEAVRQGRGIYSNIKKVVGFLLGTNIGEVICVFTAMLLWHKTPLLSMQLLWINLVTDSLPAIALGMEAVEDDVMTHKPKPKDESLFSGGLGLRVVLQGAMFAALSLIGFVLGAMHTNTDAGGQTMAFAVLALSQVIHSYNMRSDRSLFKISAFSNKKLNKACLISALLVLVVLFTPVRIAFGLEMLNAYMYFIALGLSFVPLLVMEISKLIRHMVVGKKQGKNKHMIRPS